MQTTWRETAIRCELAARGIRRLKGESWASLAAELRDTWTDPVAKAEATARYAVVGELAYEEYAARPDKPGRQTGKSANTQSGEQATARVSKASKASVSQRATTVSTRRKATGITVHGNKFKVQLRRGRRVLYVGLFDTRAAATRAYKRAASLAPIEQAAA